jgi:hypothetical protein
MMKRLLMLALAIPMLGAVAASAQNPAEPPANGANLRGLGEIMTLQQLRHIKLWFAGRAGNWALADYEMGELNEGFEDVDKQLGGDTVEKMVGGPLKALQKAIEDKNRTAFTAAFDSLSAGCNNCHRTLDHGFIVIQRPALLPYSDQVFEPQK